MARLQGERGRLEEETCSPGVGVANCQHLVQDKKECRYSTVHCRYSTVHSRYFTGHCLPPTSLGIEMSTVHCPLQGLTYKLQTF